MRWTKRAPMPAHQHIWQVWFAWYPVEVDGQYVWLERIERCRYKGRPGLAPIFNLGYRFPLDPNHA